MPADIAAVTAARDAADRLANQPATDVVDQDAICAMHDRSGDVVDKDILSPCEPSDEGEHVFRLVQDEPLITRIHNEELPPDSYYEERRKHLIQQFSGADPDLIEHAVALAAAFGTASAFALCFGIKKSQFAQKEVKLVGEIVGELGRKPNPAICEAIRKWPPVKNLKDLQGLSLIHI